VPQSRMEHKSRRGRGLGSRRARSTRGYELSNRTEPLHFSVFFSHLPIPVAPSDTQRVKVERLERQFRVEAERWKKETLHLSSVTKMISHPSYRRIMGMGPDVLPILLRELRENPDHWLVALNAITGEDPAPPDSTFDQAVDAWLAWGIEQRYLQ